MEVVNEALRKKRKFKCANCGFADGDTRGCLSADFLLLVDGSATHSST